MKYFAKKLCALIITLFIVSLLAFLAFQVIPGDVATSKLGTNATPEQVAELRTELGLDQPTLLRYRNWLVNFVQGDMGTSYNYHMPVSDMISQKLPVTAVLTIIALFLSIVVSLPLGILAARKEGGFFDRTLTVFNQIFMSIPPVFVGILLSYIFGITLKLFVPGNFVAFSDNPWQFFVALFFPALSMAVSRIAMTVKMLRSSILHEMDQNYIRTAYSRGNSRTNAMRKHALRNAMIPVTTFLASAAAELVAASIVIEQVFAVPGIGRLLLASISNRDFPVVQAIVVILATWVVAVNFIADILVQRMDPRIRLDD
ncbi:MAG: ABC transporter permease [Evtepia sp.]